MHSYYTYDAFFIGVYLQVQVPNFTDVIVIIESYC